MKALIVLIIRALFWGFGFFRTCENMILADRAAANLDASNASNISVALLKNSIYGADYGAKIEMYLSFSYARDS
jgi:hypothetical protein